MTAMYRAFSPPAILIAYLGLPFGYAQGRPRLLCRRAFGACG